MPKCPDWDSHHAPDILYFPPNSFSFYLFTNFSNPPARLYRVNNVREIFKLSKFSSLLSTNPEIEPDFNANSESIIALRSNSGHVIAFPNTNIFNYNRKFGCRDLLDRRHFVSNSKNHRLVAYWCWCN